MSEDMAVVYLNTVVSLNEGWGALLQAYREFDTLVHHIRCFERVLSACLPFMIEENESYKKINDAFPLPDNDMEGMPMEAFRGWMSAFENVMRDYGIIGRKSGDKDVAGDQLAAFFGGA